LFVRQARAVRPSFELTPANAEVVADICRRLDGLPLAIELAAARVRAMNPETILAQLRERSLQVLSGGARDAPPRHRTLRDAIDWSYDLLEPTQQQLFRSLSVFVGGCTPEAIEAVAGGGAVVDVEVLVDKHLLTFEADEHGDGDIRYQQLETIREFGLEQLTASGGASIARERHARYLVDLAERAAPALYGPEQKVWLARLLREHDNIRAALDWCTDPAEPDRVELGLRLAAALWLFWRVRGFVREGRLRLAQLLDASASAEPSVARARALYAAGYLAFAQASADEARQLLQASVDLAREVGDPWSHGYALQGLGHAALIAGDIDQARVLYSERLEVARAQQDDYGLAQALNALGEVARCSGDIPRARAWYEQSLTLRRHLGDTRGVSMSLSNLGHVALAEGDLAAARSAFSESQQLAAEVGSQYGGAICLSGLAGVAVRERDAETAARLLGAADAILERDGISMEPADLQSHSRAVAEARAALGASQFASAYTAGKRLTLQDAAALLDRNEVVEASSGACDLLSARERQVAVLIARGLTSQEIADTLVITRRTADTHADHIRDKLGLRSRAAIAAWAERNGLLSGD
jgi:non-specific serine/threonine protein kinase